MRWHWKLGKYLCTVVGRRETGHCNQNGIKKVTQKNVRNYNMVLWHILET